MFRKTEKQTKQKKKQKKTENEGETIGLLANEKYDFET